MFPSRETYVFQGGTVSLTKEKHRVCEPETPRLPPTFKNLRPASPERSKHEDSELETSRPLILLNLISTAPKH